MLLPVFFSSWCHRQATIDAYYLPGYLLYYHYHYVLVIMKQNTEKKKETDNNLGTVSQMSP